MVGLVDGWRWGVRNLSPTGCVTDNNNSHVVVTSTDTNPRLRYNTTDPHLSGVGRWGGGGGQQGEGGGGWKGCDW